MIRDNILNAVEREQIIAILRGLPQEQCISVAQALYEGGIRMIEVTFDQKSPESFVTTADTIRAINQHMGDKILVGAGTVTSVALVNLAADAGAKYIISPDVNTRVIEQTRNRDLVSMPGAMTPSEVMTAHVAGADFVKLFPAATLGAAYLKAIRAPLSHVKFLAVGGIHAGNAREFLDAGACGLGIGGNLTKKDWINNKEFDKISEAAREIVQAVRGK